MILALCRLSILLTILKEKTSMNPVMVWDWILKWIVSHFEDKNMITEKRKYGVTATVLVLKALLTGTSLSNKRDELFQHTCNNCLTPCPTNWVCNASPQSNQGDLASAVLHTLYRKVIILCCIRAAHILPRGPSCARVGNVNGNQGHWLIK